MEKMTFKKFWRVSSIRLKIGIIATLFFLILGFIVPLFPHADVILYNTYPKKLDGFTTDSTGYFHLLGTTGMGQDTFWLLVEALRNSLQIGLITACIGTVCGVFVGLFSGFVGGWVDRILMVITDTFVVIPSLPVLILMASLMGASATAPKMALILGMFAWAWPSRQIRSMALTMKERDFIHTAWFSGEGKVQVVITEILPFVLSWSLSNFMNAVLSAIGSESSLAVLGLAPASLPTLGNMIQWARARSAIMLRRWWWIVPPIVATMLLFIGLFMLITGYNDYQSMKRGR